MPAAIVGVLSEGDLVRWHEGYTERQARWLDMLAEGGHLAPAFLEGIREQHRKVHTVMSKGAITVTEDTPAREVAHLMYQPERQAGAGAARRQAGRHRRTLRPGARARREAG